MCRARAAAELRRDGEDLMADKTREIARSWAKWAADGIIEDLLDQKLVDRANADEAAALIVEHLTDIAISNSIRASRHK